jgi:hypothetical protein
VSEPTDTGKQSRPSIDRLASAGRFLFWALAFGVAFTQWPLYSENQHTKFLHGLASSGYGFLRQDWLANTLDPLPAFSFLVSATYSFLPEAVFHLYHLTLLGIYLYSVVGIACRIYPPLRSGLGRTVLSVTIIALHATLLPPFSAKVLGVSLGWLLQSGVAGQYLINPAFQPSTFGVLLVLSIYLFLSGRSLRAAVAAALAAVFHSTYLPSAAVLTASCMAITLLEPADTEHTRADRLRSALLIGTVALALVLPMLSYNLALFRPTSGEAWNRSQDIIVHFRIPHHSLPEVWLDNTVFVKIAIVLLAVLLVRKTRLFPILLLSLLAAMVLTAVQILWPNDTMAFVAPWRISAFLVPLSSCMVIASVLSAISERLAPLPSKVNLLVAALATAALATLVTRGAMAIQSSIDARRQSDRAPMLSYVKQTRAPGHTYLIPTYMAEFRLQTGAPVLVTFKSHPYKDVEVIEWHKRVLAANDFYAQPSCDKLQALVAECAITHVVVESGQLGGGCSFVEELYRDSLHAVYSVCAEP